MNANTTLRPPPLSVYVHFPWCARKCPYCDFNSHEGLTSHAEAAYLNAVVADLEADLPRVWGRVVQSIFIGGGTPNLMSPETIGATLQAIRTRLRVAPDAEITMEANPGAAEAERFVDFAEAGVNRLSIGAQSFDNQCLRSLGRIHDAAAAINAVEKAQAAGFESLNIDLMHNLPGQNAAKASADLEQAIALAPAHLSYYELTIEPNTVFAKRPPQNLPNEDASAQIGTQAHALLVAAGYQRYEVSAWSQAGAQCRHNLNYWRFGDYLGIGAGAHGKITNGSDGTITRTVKQRVPERFIAHAGGPSGVREQQLDPAELAFEFMLNALRLVDGFSVAQFEQRTGLGYARIESQIEAAIAEQLLARHPPDQVAPTERGLRFANELIGRFLDLT